MNCFWKNIGAAVTGVSCLMAVRGALGETPDTSVPSYRAPATPGASRPDPTDTPRPNPAVTGDPDPGSVSSTRSQNTLRGSANGVGNTIIIDNGSGRSNTTIENTRNGVGNRVVVVDGDVVTDTSTKDRTLGDNPTFGSMKFYSPLHGCTLYWNPRTLSWYRYNADRQVYVPAEWDQ